MNTDKLNAAFQRTQDRIKQAPKQANAEKLERQERIVYYQSYTAERIKNLNKEEFGEYIGKLWSTVMWGNKSYFIEKIISENGFDKIKNELVKLLYDNDNIVTRWNNFLKEIKGIGPATMSELLSYSNPNEYIIFNTSTVKALSYLDIENLPKYNYQYTGEKFVEICDYGKFISAEMKAAGFDDVSLLAVDYLMWDELPPKGGTITKPDSTAENKVKKSIHDEIKDKLCNIGKALGFDTRTEVKIATGAKVDVIWELTVGSMGRVSYVFEVQSQGSIDSLVLNLIKALDNPSVQAVIAVAPTDQLDKIREEFPKNVSYANKLKIWEFADVLQVHDSLLQAFTSIEKLELIPKGFI